jgi:glyoxylate utilization-related uncharacterized protein
MEKYDFKYETNGQTRIQLSVIKGSSYRYLWHEELELMAVLSGELEYFASQKSYHLKAGDMLFFPCNPQRKYQKKDSKYQKNRPHPLTEIIFRLHDNSVKRSNDQKCKNSNEQSSDMHADFLFLPSN